MGRSPAPDQPDEVADALARHLRETYGRPAIAYAAPPAPVAIGVETWIYGLELTEAPEELAGPLVLRVFPPETDPAQPRFEFVVHNTLADLGYPAPRCPLVGPDAAVLGGPFLLMRRVPGRMMMDALFAGGNLIAQAPRLAHQALTELPRTLAEEQVRLHALDPAPLEAALEEAGIPPHLYNVDGWLAEVRREVDAHKLEGFRPTIEWLAVHRPPDLVHPVICHCDFLPPNVLMNGGAVAGVIDWSHTTIADAAWDVANTRLRLAMNPFEGPGWVNALAAAIRPRMTRVYERTYFAHRQVDGATLQYYEVLLGVWLLLHVARDAVTESPASTNGRGANPWLSAPAAVRRLICHCERITGQPLRLTTSAHAPLPN